MALLFSTAHAYYSYVREVVKISCYVRKVMKIAFVILLLSHTSCKFNENVPFLFRNKCAVLPTLETVVIYVWSRCNPFVIPGKPAIIKNLTPQLLQRKERRIYELIPYLLGSRSKVD